MKKLQLFIFDEFCPDYVDGLAVAIAETEEEAKKLIEEKSGSPVNSNRWGNVRIFPLNKKIAFGVIGAS